MTDKHGKSLIVFLSPAGTTRRAARVIAETLEARGRPVSLLDMARTRSDMEAAISGLDPGDCLWVGSPVYANRALPPVLDFIDRLSGIGGVCAVPLHDLALPLREKGFRLLGGAKVMALHSMMWSCEDPLGGGRPNEEDEAEIRRLTGRVLEKMDAGTDAGLTAEDLNYQSPERQALFHTRSLKKTKAMMPPMVLDPEACTSCGLCVDGCPTNNITLEPVLGLGTDCLLCCNCVRLCHEGAIRNDVFQVIEGRIRAFAADYDEPAVTRIFS
ncbi:MAG: 4Fe-4S binding protein [Proteobacteria bacterium]|nr:4Fe-4S binding protein [Pseudomonadota bacterium]